MVRSCPRVVRAWRTLVPLRVVVIRPAARRVLVCAEADDGAIPRRAARLVVVYQAHNAALWTPPTRPCLP